MKGEIPWRPLQVAGDHRGLWSGSPAPALYSEALYDSHCSYSALLDWCTLASYSLPPFIAENPALCGNQPVLQGASINKKPINISVCVWKRHWKNKNRGYGTPSLMTYIFMGFLADCLINAQTKLTLITLTHPQIFIFHPRSVCMRAESFNHA